MTTTCDSANTHWTIKRWKLFSHTHTKKEELPLNKTEIKKKKKPYEGVKNLYSDYVIQNGWLPRKFENKFHIENPNKSQLKHKLNLPNV